MVDNDEEKILQLMMEGKEYTTGDIFNLCKFNGIDISRERLVRRLAHLEKHSPWENLGFVERKISLESVGICYIWIRIIK